MKICIVGHGKSLEGNGHGHDIDDADHVMRFKKGWMLCDSNPQDYGSRTDILVASTETLGTFPVKEPVNAQYLAYPKYGWYPEMVVSEAEKMLGRNITIPLNLLNYWNWKFKHMGAKHPNVSLGMAGVIMAAHAYRPHEIVLAGMDSIVDPTKPFHRITSVERTGVGDINHDWHKEHTLLEVLSDMYEFHITTINGEYTRSL